MFSIFDVFNALFNEVFRSVTGKLFTDAQIRAVASHAVGKYFIELLPEQSDERSARERVSEARDHIAKASAIITGMQAELGSQTQQLEILLAEVDEKKKLAEKYETLANTNQQQFSAFKSEMENSLRRELISQSEKGRVLRRIASAILWLLTLILGAALGTYFKEIIGWFRAFVV